MFTKESILKLLRKGERVTLECKRAEHKLPNSVWASYSAMANTYGGIIILGIDEVKTEKNWEKRYPIIGLANAEKLRIDFWNLLNDSEKVNFNLLVDDDVEIVELDGKDILVIRVPQADYHQKPVFINGNMTKGTYKRNHEGDYHCKETELRAMIRDASDDGNDGRRLPHYTMDDVDIQTLREYRQMFMNRNPDHSLNKKDDKEFLRQLGGYVEDRVTGEGGLTMAGLMMFGKGLSIRERFDMIRFDYIDKTNLTKGQRYRDRVTYNADWENNLFQFIALVMPRLTRDLPVPFVLEGIQRVDDTPMHKLLREAVTNMIIHADFMVSGILKIEKFDDGFLFSNPGTLKLPIEEIYHGGVSAARNPHIQDMLRMIGYGDNLGTGFPEMVEIWEGAYGEKPVLNERFELQIVELSFGGMKREEMDETDSVPQNVPQNVLQNVPQKKTRESRINAIIQFLKENPQVSRKQLAEQFGVNPKTIGRDLSTIKDKVRYVGSAKNGYWEVTETE